MHFPRRPCSAQCWMDSWQNTNVKKKKNMWWEVQRCDTLFTTPLWSRSLNVFVFVIAFVFDKTLSNGEHTGFVHWSSRANPVHSKKHLEQESLTTSPQDARRSPTSTAWIWASSSRSPWQNTTSIQFPNLHLLIYSEIGVWVFPFKTKHKSEAFGCIFQYISK